MIETRWSKRTRDIALLLKEKAIEEERIMYTHRRKDILVWNAKEKNVRECEEERESDRRRSNEDS